MCGICGFVNLDGALAERSIIERMNRALYHRGPDDQGVRLDKNVALAMRRLSIMDVAGGHQPISNEDARIWTVFNGEIYNAAELRQGLVERGHRFSTTTDTEAIVHQYEDKGIDGITDLRGMFAFALHDTRPQSRRLFLVRDRLGIKPLFYYHHGNTLAFSSELTSLLQHPAINRQVNPLALNQYLATGIVASPATMFRHVRQLMPGHYLLLEGEKLTQHVYWQLPQVNQTPPDAQEAAQRIRSLLEDSLADHLVSDVPVGAFLSGGIDSSTIVALMARASGKKIPTFSIRFSGDGYDESTYARAVAKKYDTEYHEFSVPDQGFDEGLLRAMISHHGQPTADSSALPTFIVSSLAHQHVKVALSGDGGDECFAGYSHYGWLLNIRYLYAIPRPFRALLLSGLRRAALTTPFGRLAQLRQVINALQASMADSSRLPLEVLRFNNTQDVSHLLLPAWQIDEKDVWQDMDAELADRGGLDGVAQAQRFSCRYFMPDAYLPKVDRMSMATSLEVRVPFLDHRLVEFALSLPGNMHWRNGMGKRLLRMAVTDLLPAEIFTHRKQGFSIPLHRWVDDSYFTLVEELLNEADVCRRGFFNAHAVRALIERCKGTRARCPALESEHRLSHRLFQLVVLEMWCRMYIDELPDMPVYADVSKAVRYG